MNKPYSGKAELTNYSYQIYLSYKYEIEHHELSGKYFCRSGIFNNFEEALAHAHITEQAQDLAMASRDFEDQVTTVTAVKSTQNPPIIELEIQEALITPNLSSQIKDRPTKKSAQVINTDDYLGSRSQSNTGESTKTNSKQEAIDQAIQSVFGKSRQLPSGKSSAIAEFLRIKSASFFEFLGRHPLMMISAILCLIAMIMFYLSWQNQFSSIKTKNSQLIKLNRDLEEQRQKISEYEANLAQLMVELSVSQDGKKVSSVKAMGATDTPQKTNEPNLTENRKASENPRPSTPSVTGTNLIVPTPHEKGIVAINTALDLYRKNNQELFELAIKKIPRATQYLSNPEVAKAFHAEGVTYKKAGDWKRAEESFRQAVSADPMRVLYIIEFYQATKRTGKIKESIPYLQHAITLNPRQEVLWKAYDKVMQ